MDRAFTTQAARHNEVNVNLAFADAVFRARRIRGRLAIQAGTAVQANYAGEPRVGSYGGPDVTRLLQEAYAGYALSGRLWIDAGIYFAPFGAESWISRDNWTYTRSLIADNSPYFHSGARLTWTPRPQLSAELHVVNGWNVSETNSDKALATHIQLSPRGGWAVAYNLFLGNEAPDTARSRHRVFHEMVVRSDPARAVALMATADYGVERVPDSSSAEWRGVAAAARVRAGAGVHVGLRLESYSDPRQVIVKTSQQYGLRASGGSVNVDLQLSPQLVWRSELRILRSRQPLFPDRDDASGLSGKNLAVVTSAGLTL
jgi:hypothetical protein